MTLRLVTPATTFAITLAEAKAHLRVDHDDDDALISALIGAAFAYAEKRTGRAFSAQTWEKTIDGFPAEEIGLDIGPVQSVVSVIYTDADGVSQTLATDQYEIDTTSEVGWVVRTESWPATMATINAVRVRFVVGGETPSDVRQAVLLLIGLWYDNRASATPDNMQAVPMATEALLSLHHRYYV